MADSLQTLQHILWKMPKGKHYYSHLVDEEIEAYRDQITCQRTYS